MQRLKLPKANSQLASAENMGRVSVLLKFSTVALVIVAFYLQDLSIVFNDALHDEATFHILAVPFLFAYLLYRKRNMIRATLEREKSNAPQRIRHFQVLIGVLLSTIAVIVYWYGSYTFTPLEFHMVTLPVFVAGLTLILFNTQLLRQLAFPIAFLVFLTPPPVEILYSIGSALGVLSAQAANALANLFRMSSVLSSNYGTPIIILTRPDHTVMNFNVDIACSGVYSLMGFGIFAVFIAFITRGKTWKKPAILLMGIPLIIALNIVRITAILAIGYNYGDQLALQIFHLVGATVLMFIGTLLLLAITERIFKANQTTTPCPGCTLKSPTVDSCPNCGKLHKIPWPRLRRNDLAKMAGIAIVVAVLLIIQVPVFALTAGPAQVIIQTPSGAQGNTQILPQMPGYTLNYIYRDTNFEELSGEDASLVYVYVPTNTSQPTVWVAVEVSSTLSSLHRWETCLVTFPLTKGYQPRISQLDLKDIQTLANPPIIARYFAFQYHSTNQTQVVLYWYETSTFTTNGTSQQKHVKMSLVTYPKTPQLVAGAENQLLPFALAINDYWQPIKTWTQIALAISQNGSVLFGASAALIIALLLYQAFLGSQEKASLLELYGKLADEDKVLMKAVSQAQKLGNPTTANVVNQMKTLTSGSASTDWLPEKLLEAEDAGLIRKTIVNINDEPKIRWRNRVPNNNPPLRRLKNTFLSIFSKITLHRARP